MSKHHRHQHRQRPTRIHSESFTTRPSVAMALAEAGIPITRKPNIFNPELNAWTYPDTQESRRIVWETLQAQEEGERE